MLILREVYYKYFDRDKIFRHTSQHLLVAAVGFLISFVIINFPINIKNILLFIVFSYLPDLDGIAAIFLWARKTPLAQGIKESMGKNRFGEAFTYATINHKQLKPLVIHNIIFYISLLLALQYSIMLGNKEVSIIILSILTHLTFDFFDDIYQLGHIKHWMWPLKNPD